MQKLEQGAEESIQRNHKKKRIAIMLLVLILNFGLLGFFKIYSICFQAWTSASAWNFVLYIPVYGISY